MVLGFVGELVPATVFKWLSTNSEILFVRGGGLSRHSWLVLPDLTTATNYITGTYAKRGETGFSFHLYDFKHLDAQALPVTCRL